jgi:hypothetical protein
MEPEGMGVQSSQGQSEHIAWLNSDGRRLHQVDFYGNETTSLQRFDSFGSAGRQDDQLLENVGSRPRPRADPVGQALLLQLELAQQERWSTMSKEVHLGPCRRPCAGAECDRHDMAGQ